ncbi:MAG TPA: DUF6599 family protein [Acidobacteriaceae bacterium]|nr:DUF6599 family protein [Acidobacteriaceae bacterium]
MFRLLSAFLVSSVALAAPAANQQPSSPIPASFAAWSQTGAAAQTPAPADAPVLQEFGLAQFAAADYASGANRVAVKAWQFKDATGAYGAFTYFRQPQMKLAKIGRDGAASGDHYVFWDGVTVVDATFSQPVKDEQSAMQALAAAIPKTYGAAGVPPSLPHYLPAAGLDPESVRYAIGPAAYSKMGGALPASQIDFGQDAEAITGRYGQETLTLVMYPTPQIAGAHLKAIEAAGLTARRSGPLVAAVSGNAPAQTANQLLSSIRFDDYVTINHPEGYVPETVKLYRLLMGITVLVVILVASAIFIGLFLGGGRALIRKLRGKPVSSVSEEEFISLHLGS